MAAGLLERKAFELHPDGPAVLTLADYEGPKDGKFGPQIAWKFDSEEEMENGDLFSLWYWTGTALSPDPRNKLNKLLTAFGLDTENVEIETLDPDDLIGKKVNAMVVHGTGTDGAVRANIDSMTPVRKRKAAEAPAKAAEPVEKPEWGEDD